MEWAWLDEAERRAAELDSGEAESIPAADLFSELDSLVNE
ncbi:MAG: addiction module protein [Gemmatimonadetes bacterium]|nr:addiction module protein [Gemmatimonadota bacterium]MCH8812842.1 addiction module protein [Gemmatimonadota bacterium]